MTLLDHPPSEGGRELDERIAVEVMGLVKGTDFGTWEYAEHEWRRTESGEIDTWVLEYEHHNGPGCVRCHYSYCEHCQEGPDEPCKVEKSLREYSTSIADAFLVVERMRERFSLWRAFTVALQREVSSHDGLVAHEFVWRLVKPHHICLAALKAINAQLIGQ